MVPPPGAQGAAPHRHGAAIYSGKEEERTAAGVYPATVLLSRERATNYRAAGLMLESGDVATLSVSDPRVGSNSLPFHFRDVPVTIVH